MTRLNKEVAYPESRWQHAKTVRERKNEFIQSLSITFVLLFIFAVLFYIGLLGSVSATFLGNLIALISATLFFAVLVLSAIGVASPQRIFGDIMRRVFEAVFTFFLRFLLLLAYPVLVFNAKRVRVRRPETHPSLVRWASPNPSYFSGNSTWLQWKTEREIHLSNPVQRTANIFFSLKRKYGTGVALLLTIILIIATLLVLIQSSAVAPFIYTLF